MTDLDTLCEAARKRLERGVAISAGKHSAAIRRKFEESRQTTLMRWMVEDAKESIFPGGWGLV
jgi:hypothetical protein